jgi:hypothetical protein
MCTSVSNITERKGTPVNRNVLICSFLQFLFPAEQRCGSGKMVAKGLRSIARKDVGVHNDADLQTPSPYKAFLYPKTRLGFTVCTCLSFKQIHKNFTFPIAV